MGKSLDRFNAINAKKLKDVADIQTIFTELNEELYNMMRTTPKNKWVDVVNSALTKMDALVERAVESDMFPQLVLNKMKMNHRNLQDAFNRMSILHKNLKPNESFAFTKQEEAIINPKRIEVSESLVSAVRKHNVIQRVCR